MNSKNTRTIKKCPNCGAVLESFQIRCSMCGFEVSKQKVSSTMKTFTKQISLFDDLIYGSNSSTEDITISQKKIPIFLWIILWLCGVGPFVLLYRYLEKVTGKKNLAKLVFVSLFFVFGGAVIIKNDTQRGIFLIALGIIGGVLIYLLIAFFSKPELTADEKRKAEYILTFPIPNSREDILEFTLFCSTRYKTITVTKTLFTKEGKKQQYWNTIWKDKIKQIYGKATIAMVDDPVSLQTVQTLIKNSGMKI